MKWGVTVPGSPVSWDEAYPIGVMPVKRQGKAVLREDGTQKVIHRPVLAEKARLWRDACQMLMQAARPSRWAPEGKVRVRWTFYVTRTIDSDNLIKLPSDALQRATGIDDKRYLHCVEDVIVVKDPRECRAEVLVDDDWRCCWART